MQRNIEALTDGVYDVLVLGGGITGAGVALDAVTRGWRVALIDKSDFASGTSSVSSKLVHGGLRYLEQAQFHLVFESLRERGLLLRNAPNLVQPLRFVIPFYQGARVPPWKWRLGLTMYDLLAGAANIQRSRPLTTGHVLRAAPTLLGAGLVGGAAYFDAHMDDARLCLEVLRTAQVHGATVANYVEALAFESNDGVIAGVRAVDRVTGQEFLIRAKQTLNATGPWVDAVCKLAGDDTGPHLEATKGVHLILPGRELDSALLLLHPRDGRVFFVIPWLGKTLVGTTDTIATAGPDAQVVTDADVAYLREGYEHHFPTDTTPQVLGSFVGLRPLMRARPSEPSARSREFRVLRSRSGLLSVVGGKYTTFRAMAENIVDRLERRLGAKRRCRTRALRLACSPVESWPTFRAKSIATLVDRVGIAPASAARLVDRYGANWPDVIHYLDAAVDGREPLVAGEPELRGEIVYQRDHEMALRPDDHWRRRLRLGMYCVPNIFD